MKEQLQENKQIDIKEVVLSRIQAHTVVMRPKIYFTLQVIGFTVLAVSILLLSIFILGMISFSVRISGHAFFFGQGLKGVWLFLSFFPWIPLLFWFVLIGLLVKMVRTYSFGYRHPAVIILVFSGLFCLGAGLALDWGTGMNDKMYENSMRQARPGPIDTIYVKARRVPPPLHSIERERRGEMRKGFLIH